MGNRQRNFIQTLNRQERLLPAEPLAKYTTFQIGGKAKYLVVVKDLDNLQKILKLTLAHNLAYFIIGAGSNLLISDQGFPGIVIKLGKGFSQLAVQGEKIISGAGVKLADLIKFAYDNGLEGTEFLNGIPGTLGGAIMNNAGAFSHCTGDIIESVAGIRVNSQFEIENLKLRKNQIEFGYRKSGLSKDFIITEAAITLIKSEPKKIQSKIERIKKRRRETQPWGASAGSVFKNPKPVPAGKLLDQAGLKGFSVGEAYVSPKHANFIMNRSHATFNDVLELIQIMKMRVEKKTGIILEEEIEIVPSDRLEVRNWSLKTNHQTSITGHKSVGGENNGKK